MCKTIVAQLGIEGVLSKQDQSNLPNSIEQGLRREIQASDFDPFPKDVVVAREFVKALAHELKDSVQSALKESSTNRKLFVQAKRVRNALFNKARAPMSMATVSMASQSAAGGKGVHLGHREDQLAWVNPEMWDIRSSVAPDKNRLGLIGLGFSVLFIDKQDDVLCELDEYLPRGFREYRRWLVARR